MTQGEAAKLFAILLGTYSRNIPSPETTGPLYEKFLMDLPFSLTERVLIEHISKSKWLPTIAEIRVPVMERIHRLPSFGDVLDKLQGVSQDERLELHPAVRSALKECGGRWEMQHTKDGTKWREQFRRTYSEHRAAFLDRLNEESVVSGQLSEKPKPRELQS